MDPVVGPGVRVALVLVVLCGSAAADPAPTFDETRMLSVRVGYTSLARVGGSHRGTGPTPELELRAFVSPHASLGGYLNRTAYTFQREYYGTYTPIPIALTEVGARLAWQPDPRIALGIAFGFAAYRESEPMGPTIREYGQFLGVFGDATVVQRGQLGVVLGVHAETGSARSATATIGIGWLGW